MKIPRVIKMKKNLIRVWKVKEIQIILQMKRKKRKKNQINLI